MNIEVRNRQRKYKVDYSLIKNSSRVILSLCGLSNVELSILIVNNTAIKELNREYRGIDRPTDVLAFPMGAHTPSPHPSPLWGEGKGEGGISKLLGDIVISMEKIYSQAEECGHSPAQELKTLLTHGILHLLGYDHEGTRLEAQRMRRKENFILSKI
ncbi:MAG: rRNA maturation RNase YbeY [Nitrospirae bacterium]|nr:rRNA maturation RNase YbeY [Nitrospirota bacterium]